LSLDLWAECQINEVAALPFDIDGACCYKLNYDNNAPMRSSQDGRPWGKWVTSSRVEFDGQRRTASCSGTYQCHNSRCPFLHSYSKANKVNFKKKGKEDITCSCCGYEATQVQCPARKVWEFHKDFVIVYHYGNHSCEAKTVDKSIRDDAAEFFRANTSAKPSQYPYERLRKMLKEGSNVSDVYQSACSMANLKDIQNIKQKVVTETNPVGHSFEALAKIKEETDKFDKYLLWKVQDGRLNDGMTVVFRSSKERIETAALMQQGGASSSPGILFLGC